MLKRSVLVFAAVLLAACATPAGVPSAAPSPSPLILDGTSWVAKQIKGAATLAEHQPTVAFAGGRVTGNASCNRYSAEFTQAGSSLTFGAVAQTAMACTDDKLNAQERAFSAALGEVTQVRSSAGGAELLNAAGEAVLTLAAAPVPTPKPLVGTEWTLSGIVSGDAVQSPLADTTVTMTLTDEALTGKACNTFRGSVTKTDSTIKVGPIMSTRMACPTEGEGKQESSVLAALGSVTSYAIEGDTLTLSGPDSKGLLFTAS